MRGSGHLPGYLKDFKVLKVDKIVDIFVQLTVNKLLGRLANTLANRLNGAEIRKRLTPSPPNFQIKSYFHAFQGLAIYLVVKGFYF